MAIDATVRVYPRAIDDVESGHRLQNAGRGLASNLTQILRRLVPEHVFGATSETVIVMTTAVGIAAVRTEELGRHVASGKAPLRTKLPHIELRAYTVVC